MKEALMPSIKFTSKYHYIFKTSKVYPHLSGKVCRYTTIGSDTNKVKVEFQDETPSVVVHRSNILYLNEKRKE